MAGSRLGPVGTAVFTRDSGTAGARAARRTEGRGMGALRKAGVWLGLVEEDDDQGYDDGYDKGGYRESRYRDSRYADEFADDEEPDDPPPRARPDGYWRWLRRLMWLSL